MEVNETRRSISAPHHSPPPSPTSPSSPPSSSLPLADAVGSTEDGPPARALDESPRYAAAGFVDSAAGEIPVDDLGTRLEADLPQLRRSSSAPAGGPACHPASGAHRRKIRLDQQAVGRRPDARLQERSREDPQLQDPPYLPVRARFISPLAFIGLFLYLHNAWANRSNRRRVYDPMGFAVHRSRQRRPGGRYESPDIETGNQNEEQERKRARRDGWWRLLVLVGLVIVYRTCFVVLWWLLEKNIKENGVLAWLKPGVWLVSTIIYWLLKKLLNRRYRVTPKEDYHFCIHAFAYCIFRGLVDTKIGSQGLLIPLIVAHIVSFSIDLLGAVFIAFFFDDAGDMGEADMC